MKHFVRASCALRFALLIALFFLPLMLHGPAADGRHWKRPASPEESLIHEIDQAIARDAIGGVR